MQAHLTVGIVLLLGGLAGAHEEVRLSPGPSSKQILAGYQACYGACEFSVQICTDMPVWQLRVRPARVGTTPSPDVRPAGCSEPTLVTLRLRSPRAPMRVTLRARAFHGDPPRVARSRLTLRCLPNPRNFACPVPTTTTTTLPVAECAAADVQCCSGGELWQRFRAGGVELRRDDDGVARTNVCDAAASTVAATSCDGAATGPATACCLRNGCPWFAVHGGNQGVLGDVCREGGGTLVRGPCDAEPIHPLRPCLVTGCSGQLCASSHIGTTCEWNPGFACLRDAVCERQEHGGCGWTVLPGSPPCPAAD